MKLVIPTIAAVVVAAAMLLQKVLILAVAVVAAAKVAVAMPHLRVIWLTIAVALVQMLVAVNNSRCKVPVITVMIFRFTPSSIYPNICLHLVDNTLIALMLYSFNSQI